MKKTISILICLIISLNLVYSQQDEEAEKVILNFQSNFEQLQGFTADISLTVDNKQENQFTTYNGKFKLKKEKYYISIQETEIFSDGISRWVYMPDVDEVTVSNLADEEEDMMNNPFQIFDNFKEKFKYKLVGEMQFEGETVNVIELYPYDLDETYHTISLRIAKKSNLLQSARYMSKNGVHYLIDLSNIEITNLEDNEFVFNSSQHPDAEIIDLR